MKILKVGIQVIQISDHELDQLLVKMWGNVADQVRTRLENHQAVNKAGEQWAIVDHYQHINNDLAVQETAKRSNKYNILNIATIKPGLKNE